MTLTIEIRNNQQGINEKLTYVGEQAKCNYDDISTLKTENINLRRELELLRSVVVRMDRWMSIIDNEITYLWSRSMRDNVLIHNFKYTSNENLAVTMPALKKHSGYMSALLESTEMESIIKNLIGWYQSQPSWLIVTKRKNSKCQEN